MTDSTVIINDLPEEVTGPTNESALIELAVVASDRPFELSNVGAVVATTIG